jgi:hypothetical protein
MQRLELHAGAIRGLGDAGMQLESLHRVAESIAKAELVVLVVVLVLHAHGRARAISSARSERAERSEVDLEA